jgi:hypothetical protein
MTTEQTPGVLEQPGEVMRVRLLVALTTENGQITDLWVVANTAAAARLANRLAEQYPAGYGCRVMRVGDLLSTSLLDAAAQLEAVASVAAQPVQGEPASMFDDHARRQGVAAGLKRGAALVRRRGEQMQGWQL